MRCQLLQSASTSILESMLARGNLLVSLFQWAHRQQENFTTEAFAHLLAHLIETDRPFASEFLTWLTDSAVPLGADDLADAEVTTQARTETCGTPDVRIVAADLDVIIEIKLDGRLTHAQARAYRDELDASSKSRKHLVALTGVAPFETPPEGTALRTWMQVGERLIEIEHDAPVAEHLVREFVQLLYHLRLMPPTRVASPLARALDSHFERSLATPGAPSLTTKRIRNLKTLEAWEELEPLRCLLHQMQRVVETSGHSATPRLDSGPSGVEQWIGYSINSMEYFFYVSLRRPECVVVQRYRGGVDPTSFDGSFGTTDVGPVRGPRSWRGELDLLDAGYFAQDATGQMQVLSQFFERAIAYAKQLRPAPS